MSSWFGSSSRAKRAKCRFENSPKGTKALFGSATPGTEFMVPSSCRNAGSRLFVIGAPPANCDCGVTALELQAEMDQPVLAPVHHAQIEIRRDETDLVADVMRHDGRIGIVQDDALLAVQPTGTLVDPGDNRLEAERENPV